MLKRYSILLFVFLLIGGLSYKIFLKLGESAKIHEQPIDYFPDDPSFFMLVNDFSKTFDNISATSMIWSKIADDTLNNKILDFKNNLNNIIEDSIFDNLFFDGETYLGFYNYNGKNEWIIAKNIFKDNFKFSTQKNEYKNDLFTHFYSLSNSPFLVISSSESLLNEFNYNYVSKIKSGLLIKNKMSFSSETSKISCLLNIDKLKNSNNMLLGKSISSEYFDLLQTTDWIQFDVNFTPNKIDIIGIGNENININIPPPNYFSFTELIPENVEFLSKEMINYTIDSLLDKRVALQTLEFKFIDNIQNEKHEILIIENPTDSGLYSSFLGKIILDSTIKTSFQDNLMIINTAYLNKYIEGFEFANKYAFIGDNYLIISSIKSKNELDYELAHKNQNDIDLAILDVNENKEYSQAQSFFVYHSSNEINQRLKDSIVNSLPPSFFNSIGGISWSVNNFSNRVHHGLSISTSKDKKSEKNILWKLSLPPISWGPFTLQNHRSGTKDIAVLDSLNKFYLIGANGKIKWSKILSEPIIGGIQQIDVYDNGKYQMVFNTKNKLHILDILGNEIDKFPLNFTHHAANQVSVFDYDNNKDYRFLIVAESGKIFNYNIDAKKVNGWEIPELNNHIFKELNHFAINGKDYIFSLEKNGKMNLFNRKGELRYTIDNKIAIANGENYWLKKSFNIDSSYIIFKDTFGNISEFKFGGDFTKLYDYKLVKDDISLNTNSNNNELSFYMKNNNSLKIVVENNQIYDFIIPYNFSIFSQNAPKNHTILLNNSISEIQFIDAKYRLHPTIFRGSDLYCLDDINYDKYKELITVVNQNILVCYQVPVLK